MRLFCTLLAVLELVAFGWLAYWGITLRPMLAAAPVLGADAQFFMSCQKAVAAGTGALVMLSACAALQALLVAPQAGRQGRIMGIALAVLPVIGLALFYAWLHRGQ